jgi:anaerobic selenocysteine-containing dehydrogenase
MITSRELELEDMLPVKQKQKMIGANRFRVFGWDGNELIYKNVKRVWKKAPNTVYGQCNAHAPTLYRTIITRNPYPIKALLVSASNPMVTAPNTKLIYKALKSPNLDLIVVHDFFMTPSAELADYVLPAAGWLERADLWNFQNYSNYVFAKEAALPKTVPNKYEHYTDFDFYRGLGLRLGQEKYWPWNNLEEAFNHQIQPMSYDIKTLPRLLNWKINYQKYEENGFGTITGKVELYSTLFEKLGYDPLPYFEEPPESPISDPEMAANYPLTLLTGARIYLYYHSEWRQIDSIRNIHPYPLVQIHPDTAKKLGIKEGEWVWIETPRGRVRQKAVLFKGMAPNIVQAEHGWWLPELPGEEPWLHGVWDVSINVLTDDDPDHCNPHIGSWQLRHTLCKVYKVKQY